MDTSYDELSRKVLGELNNLDHFDLAQSDVTRFWKVFFRTAEARILSYRLLRNIRRLNVKFADKSCAATCEYFKKNYSALLPKLSLLAEKERDLLKDMNRKKVPNLIIRTHEAMLADYEDLIENCSLALDEEFHQLVNTVSDKLMQK